MCKCCQCKCNSKPKARKSPAFVYVNLYYIPDEDAGEVVCGQQYGSREEAAIEGEDEEVTDELHCYLKTVQVKIPR